MNRKTTRGMLLLIGLVLWLVGAGQVLAAGEPTVFLHVHQASGGQVRVTLEGTQIGNVTNGKMRIYYKAEEAKLIQSKVGAVLSNGKSTYEINDVTGTKPEGEAVLVFAASDDFSADGVFLDMTFALQGNTKAEDMFLSVTVEELALNGNDISTVVGAVQRDAQNSGGNSNNDQSGGNATPTVKKDISTTSVDPIKNQTFNNKKKKPSVKVKDGNTVLVQGTDYTLSYKNNKKTGKATVVIQGKGNYTGTKTVYFNIVPKKATIKKVTSPSNKKIKVTVKKDAQADGYEIQCALNKSFKKGKKTVTLKKKTIITKTIGKCKSGKKYFVRVRSFKKIDGKKVYGAYSKVKPVNVK